MAKDNVEIEIKLPLTEAELSSVRGKLAKIARFVKKSGNIDVYYAPAHRNFLAEKYPFEWLSVRKRGDKAILNYKHFHPEGAETKTHCDEFETVVENADQLEKILKALDFRKLVTVDKEREVWETEGFEIALDKVKELGHFIEIEALTHSATVEETRKRLFSFAKQLGVGSKKEDLKGYPMLLIGKKGLMKCQS